MNYAIAYYYDPSGWKQVTDSYVLNPLDGIFICINMPDTAFFRSSAELGVYSRNLSTAQSWYLVGPTPSDCNFPATFSMPADEALASLEMRSMPGAYAYTQVFSPATGNQEPWVYIAGWGEAPDMQIYRAYWVFVQTPSTLAGFTSTPLPMPLPSSEGPP